MRRRLAIALLIGALGASGQTPRQSRPAGGRQSGRSGNNASPDITIAFDGVLKAIDKKRVVIDNAEGNEVVFERTRATVFLTADGKKLGKEPAAGAQVAVDGKKLMTGILTAVQVRLR